MVGLFLSPARKVVAAAVPWLAELETCTRQTAVVQHVPSLQTVGNITESTPRNPSAKLFLHGGVAWRCPQCYQAKHSIKSAHKKVHDRTL